MENPVAFWNARYANPVYVYGQAPNVFFAEQLATLPSGTLLLPGDGEGRNGVHAARQGWEVTSLDQSQEGQRKALQLAAQHQIALTYHVMDVLAFVPDQPFDVVALIFLHAPQDNRRQLLTQLLSWVRPGGHLILEGYVPAQIGLGTGGPDDPTWMYTPEELTSAFGGWTIQRCAAVEKQLQEGPYHNGPSRTVEFVVQRPRLG